MSLLLQAIALDYTELRLAINNIQPFFCRCKCIVIKNFCLLNTASKNNDIGTFDTENAKSIVHKML